jgi:hypothetical protein
LGELRATQSLVEAAVGVSIMVVGLLTAGEKWNDEDQQDGRAHWYLLQLLDALHF